MKLLTISKYIFCGLALTLAACSGSESDPDFSDSESEPATGTPRTLQLTITQTETRATLTPSGDKLDELAPSWTANDKLTYRNFENNATGPLTATVSATISPFVGSVTCYPGHKLAVVYPAVEITDTYTITLSEQDGTLETLASKYHYVYGVATVNSVTETTASATMPKMKSLLTACKFSFKDKATNASIPVKSLKISFNIDGDGGYKGTYPQTATVLLNKDQSNVHATAVPGSAPLLVELDEARAEVYVAMVPTNPEAPTPRQFYFRVFDGTDYFTGTAKAHLPEGEYVVATDLKLNKE